MAAVTSNGNILFTFQAEIEEDWKWEFYGNIL
jgi:hypothetical protein